jgi:hypothetical protein
MINERQRQTAERWGFNKTLEPHHNHRKQAHLVEKSTITHNIFTAADRHDVKLEMGVNNSIGPIRYCRFASTDTIHLIFHIIHIIKTLAVHIDQLINQSGCSTHFIPHSQINKY